MVTIHDNYRYSIIIGITSRMNGSFVDRLFGDFIAVIGRISSLVDKFKIQRSLPRFLGLGIVTQQGIQCIL